jgi:hypothetical protein
MARRVSKRQGAGRSRAGGVADLRRREAGGIPAERNPATQELDLGVDDSRADQTPELLARKPDGGRLSSGSTLPSYRSVGTALARRRRDMAVSVPISVLSPD